MALNPAGRPSPTQERVSPIRVRYSLSVSTMIKGVIFDIDGVLLDSFEAGLHFFGDVLVKMGHSKPTRAQYKTVFHLPLEQALKSLAKSELTEELERLHEIVDNVSYRTELLSEPLHMRETLDILSTQYKLAIVTSRNKQGLHRRYFPSAHTEKYFPVRVTREDVTHYKPHPEPLLLAAKRLRLKPSECVYIGDSHTDVDAGRSAGMKTILYGGKKHGDADVHTRTFKNLPHLIASLT